MPNKCSIESASTHAAGYSCCSNSFFCCQNVLAVYSNENMNQPGRSSPNFHDEKMHNQQPHRIPTSSITEVDVLCGRQRQVFNHPGNVTFRSIVAHYLVSYTTSPSRSQKTSIVKEIIGMVRSRGGRFLRHAPDTSDWIVLSDHESKDKVGHSLRDTNKGGKRSVEHSTTNPGPRIEWNTSTSQPFQNDFSPCPDTSFSREKHEPSIDKLESKEQIQKEYTTGSGNYACMRHRHSDSSSSHSASLILEMLPNYNSMSSDPVLARTVGIALPDCSTGNHLQPLNVTFEQYYKQRTQQKQQPNRHAAYSSNAHTSRATLTNTVIDDINRTGDNDHEFLDRIYDVLGPLTFDGRDPLNDFVPSDEDP